jgi:glyoxylase I family protein
MIKLKSVHHIAIICSDYQRSKKFYTGILGFKVLAENFREDRKSYKLDLMLDDRYCIELFSFQDPPPRVSRPEACGLRHLAFEVDRLEPAINWLTEHNVSTEPVRVDEYTQKRFTFFSDPDNLPLELYEQQV